MRAWYSQHWKHHKNERDLFRVHHIRSWLTTLIFFLIHLAVYLMFDLNLKLNLSLSSFICISQTSDAFVKSVELQISSGWKKGIVIPIECSLLIFFFFLHFYFRFFLSCLLACFRGLCRFLFLLTVNTHIQFHSV